MRWRASRNGSSALARLARLLRIFAIGLRFGLHEFVPRYSRRWIVRLFARRQDEPRGQRLREALETLGPIYVKFGQVLSTRRDLLPLDIADELARLQDRVPPFPSDLAVGEIERSLAKPIAAVFSTFDRTPPRSPRCTLRRCTTGARSRSRCCGRAWRGRSPGTSRCSRPRRDSPSGCGSTAGACGRARWWPSSRATWTRSSISWSRRPTRASCGATSSARRCSSYPSCTGTCARSA